MQKKKTGALSIRCAKQQLSSIRCVKNQLCFRQLRQTPVILLSISLNDSYFSIRCAKNELFFHSLSLQMAFFLSVPPNSSSISFRHAINQVSSSCYLPSTNGYMYSITPNTNYLFIRKTEQQLLSPCPSR